MIQVYPLAVDLIVDRREVDRDGSRGWGDR